GSQISIENDAKGSVELAGAKATAVPEANQPKSEHEIAAWIFSKHGRVKLPAGGAIFEANNDSQLPAGDAPIVGGEISDQQIMASDLALLAPLSKLRSLSLSRTGIGDAGLKHLSHLTGLEELALDGTNVSDSGIIHLAMLEKLTNVSLKDTKVTLAGAAKL